MLQFNTGKNIYFGICIFLSLISQAQRLKISRLTTNCYVFSTYQSFKGNLVSANGMYVLTKQGALLIDTPWDSTQFQPLLDSIEKKHKQKVILCIATHSHEDRAGGLKFYSKKGIRTYTSLLTDSILKAHGEGRAEFHFIRDTVFDIGGHKFHITYAGAGHTIDNLVVWLPKEKILYGGCLIKSTEAADLGYIKESDLKAWPATLQKVRQRFPHPKFIITGHQDWKENSSIEHTLELLKTAQNK